MCEIPKVVNGTFSALSIKGKLMIDYDSEMVCIGDKVLNLSPHEYELLYHLVNNTGAMIPSEVLTEKVFPEQGTNLEYLTLYMNKFMEKLGDNPSNPSMIIYASEEGYKYIFKESSKLTN